MAVGSLEQRMAACERSGGRSLDLTFLDLDAWPAEAIVRFPELERLEISVRKPYTPALEGMAALRRLRLGGPVTRLPVLPNLEYLLLTSQSTFPPGIEGLTGLTELVLTYSKVPTVPDALTRLPALERLTLTCALKELPQTLGELQQLTWLNAGYNPLKTLPNSLCDCEALEHLDLQWTQLRRLPRELGRLQKLRRLQVNDGRLVSVPKSLGTLTALRRLSLGNNRITKLPDLAALTALEHLSVYSNRLTELPALSGPALKELWAGGNPIGSLGPSVGQWTGLEQLFASACELTEIPEGVRRMRRLKQLHLARNRLTTLPPWLDELPLLPNPEPWHPADEDPSTWTSISDEPEPPVGLDVEGNPLTSPTTGP